MCDKYIIDIKKCNHYIIPGKNLTRQKERDISIIKKTRIDKRIYLCAKK